MSKFDRLFQAAKPEEAAPPLPELPPVIEPPPTPLVAPTPVKAATKPRKAAVAGAKSAEPAKISGKRQHPSYVGLTTYVRKDVHRRVKIALLVEGKNRELSELVDELLETWVVRQKG